MRGLRVQELGDVLESTTLDPPGSPPAHSGVQTCVTLMNRTGFLCHDRRSCIPASKVCDGVRTCAHGEDEDEALCREYLLSPAHPRWPLQVSLGVPPIPTLPAGILKLEHP